MKYKPRMYAKALTDALSQKTADEKKIVANFLNLLKKNQDMKKAREILEMTQKMMLKASGNKKILLESARKVNFENVIGAFAKKGDMVEEKINPALIAGIKIIIDNERQIDNSLLAKLNKIT